MFSLIGDPVKNMLPHSELQKTESRVTADILIMTWPANPGSCTGI